MKRFSMRFAVALMVVVISGSAYAGKNTTVSGMGGQNIEGIGLALDASYDQRLDSLVPGYKIVSVVLSNQSFNLIYMDPDSDGWWVKLVGKSSPIKAKYNLRQQDPKAWATLPDRVKQMIGYPLVLPIGSQQVIDIFVPDDADLTALTEVHFKINSIGKKVEVMVTK